MFPVLIKRHIVDIRQVKSGDLLKPLPAKQALDLLTSKVRIHFFFGPKFFFPGKAGHHLAISLTFTLIFGTSFLSLCFLLV